MFNNYLFLEQHCFFSAFQPTFHLSKLNNKRIVINTFCVIKTFYNKF